MEQIGATFKVPALPPIKPAYIFVRKSVVRVTSRLNLIVKGCRHDVRNGATMNGVSMLGTAAGIDVPVCKFVRQQALARGRSGLIEAIIKYDIASVAEGLGAQIICQGRSFWAFEHANVAQVDA